MTTTCAPPRAGRVAAPAPRSARALRSLRLPLIALCASLLFSPRAAAQPAHDTQRAVGFWPDIALCLGGGIGIGHPIATNVYGALRAGVLFAFEPWVINLGLAGE